MTLHFGIPMRLAALLLCLLAAGCAGATPRYGVCLGSVYEGWTCVP